MNRRRGRSQDNFLVALGIVPCVVISLGAFLVVPRFRAVFASAGVPLPLVTRAVFATFPWWGMTVLATVALWAFWPYASNRDKVVCSVGSTCAIVLILFGLWGCYAPIFALAGTY